jgi:conjugative transposon TraM protein
MITDSINFKQPKYILPLIVFFPLLVTAYFVLDIFDTELVTAPTSLETTEYLNSNLPSAQIKDDGIGNRYESMLKSFGRIQDYSAVESIGRGDNEEDKESYSSKYSEEDLTLLNADAARKMQELEKLRNMEERIRQGVEKGNGMSDTNVPDTLSEADRLERTRQRQGEAMAELNKALAEARLKGQKGLAPINTDTLEAASVQSFLKEGKKGTEGLIIEGAVKGLDEDGAAKEVVKLMNKSSDYFYTIAENESDPQLIKAIIDENVTAVDGSRVRLRLLDDVVISDCMLEKGTYLYATMSGFGAQRVKGNVQSILVEDELVKVNLSIYDADGLEGLYVPSSKFRETAQNVAGGAIGGNMNMNTTGGGNMLQQWGMNALNNAYQKTTSAVASSVKKNRAKLKYGSFVYLINGREKRNNQ